MIRTDLQLLLSVVKTRTSRDAASIGVLQRYTTGCLLSPIQVCQQLWVHCFQISSKS